MSRKVVALLSAESDCFNMMEASQDMKLLFWPTCSSPWWTVVSCTSWTPSCTRRLRNMIEAIAQRWSCSIRRESRDRPEQGLTYKDRGRRGGFASRRSQAEASRGTGSLGAILSNYRRNRVEDVCCRLGLKSLAFMWSASKSPS